MQQVFGPRRREAAGGLAGPRRGPDLRVFQPHSPTADDEPTFQPQVAARDLDLMSHGAMERTYSSLGVERRGPFDEIGKGFLHARKRFGHGVLVLEVIRHELEAVRLPAVEEVARVDSGIG